MRATAQTTSTSWAHGCMGPNYRRKSRTKVNKSVDFATALATTVGAMSGPSDRFEELRRRHAEAELGGGEERIRRQHKAGKKTARERLELLLDPGSFLEMDQLRRPPEPRLRHGTSSRSSATAWSPARAASTAGPCSSSPRTSPSSAGRCREAYARKICKVMDLAMKTGAPVIGLNDSGGARIQEGVVSLAGYADIFLRNTLASGVVPQISAIMGPVRGRRRVLAGHHRLHRSWSRTPRTCS